MTKKIWINELLSLPLQYINQNNKNMKRVILLLTVILSTFLIGCEYGGKKKVPVKYKYHLGMEVLRKLDNKKVMIIHKYEKMDTPQYKIEYIDGNDNTATSCYVEEFKLIPIPKKVIKKVKPKVIKVISDEIIEEEFDSYQREEL